MPPAPTLHFFCGKAGAGKTTVASRLAQDHGAILISEDIFFQAPDASEGFKVMVHTLNRAGITEEKRP